MGLFLQSYCNPNCPPQPLLSVGVKEHFGFALCDHIVMYPPSTPFLKPNRVAEDGYVPCSLLVVAVGGLIGVSSACLVVLVFISKEAVWFPFSWATAGVDPCSLMWMATKAGEPFVDSEQKSPSGCFDFIETLPWEGSARLVWMPSS